MLRSVHAAVVLSLTPLAFGQTTPSPTLTLTPPAPPELLKNASFEQPAVKGRVSAMDGGTPARADEDKTDWTHLQVFQEDKEGEGKFTVGLTNEFARSGKQSVFVDLNKVTALNRRSFLMSDLLPIKPANTYRIAIWGRTDKKRPLTLDQRLLFMKVEMEFFTPDTESQSGDTANRTLLVPGNSKRIFFVSNKWTEYETSVRTPRDAGWMKVTFRWETGRDKGTTDGTIYFDDASVTLVPGGESLIPVDASDAAKPEPEADSETDNPTTPPKAPEPAKAPGKK
jgi:hypothetical protein